MDIILYNIIACLASLILGYFFGSIPTGVILCRLIYNADPRDGGSKNSGGTNVGRLFGKKIGLLTIVLDGVKTMLPMFLVWILLNFAGIKDSFAQNLGEPMFHNGYTAIILAPLGATIGHCWPIFANFKGGKAVASYAGFGISTCWASFSGSLIAFFTTLKISKHVSLSSMIGAACSTMFAWVIFILGITVPSFNSNVLFWGFGNREIWVTGNLEFAIVSTLISVVLILRHIPNIKRLAKGTESKVSWIK